MGLSRCCICLNQDAQSTLLYSDNGSVNYLEKLMYITPELEWLERFTVCVQCSYKLNEAYNFKKMCCDQESYRKAHRAEFTSSFVTEDQCSVLSDRSDSDDNINIIDVNIAKEKTTQQSVEVASNNCKQLDEKKHTKQNLSTLQKTKNKIITCEKCGSKFDTRKAFNSHKKLDHTEAKVPKFKCEKCDKSFLLLKHILLHCMTDHLMIRKDIKPYQCDQCLTRFASCSLLIQHKKYHNGERQFTCSMCGKSFITKRDLIGHEKLHSNERRYLCAECDKTFNTSQNLKTHQYVVHTDSSKWKYSCPECSKKFAMKANWNEHIKRHQGNKEFICHICKKYFVSNHEMKKHKKLHSNISSFKCSHCSKLYRDKRGLDVHLSKIHGIGEIKASSRIKKFVCHICPSQFYDNSKLQRHIRTHTGIKPFSCGQCEKRFIDKSYLSQHLKTVHGYNVCDRDVSKEVGVYSN